MAKRARLGSAAAAALVLALTGGSTSAPAGANHHPPRPPQRRVIPVAALQRIAKHAKKGPRSAARQGPVRLAGAKGAGHMAADLPSSLTTAMEATGQTFAGAASFVTVPSVGTPDAASDTLSPALSAPGFPTDGSNFAVLTTGDANLAGTANDSGSSGVDDGPDPATKGAKRDNAHDVTILKVPLTVPKGVNCLMFDYRFLSDEYPEWVGTPYNDAFVAELDTNSWTATGTDPLNPISAPKNFAFDPGNRPISINATGTATMSPGSAFNTTYDGATPVLTAASPITSGAHTLYLSIFDQGDFIYDSTVFVDNLRLASVAKCTSGSFVDEQPADLSLKESETPGSTSIHYDLTVKNNGPSSASNVTVTDTLPDGVSFTAATPSAGSCSQDAGIVTCSDDSLAAGGELDIGIDVGADPGFYDNKSIATSSTFDPQLANNTATGSSQVGNGGLASADLSLVKTGPSSAAQGDTVEYQITVTNNGPDDVVQGLTVDDQWPSQLYFVGGFVDGDGYVPGFDFCFQSSANQSEVECNFTDPFVLASGDSITLDLLGYVEKTGTVDNSATVTAPGTSDPDLSNNSSSTELTATPATKPTGDVVLTKTVDKLLAPLGGTVAWTLTVTNKGSAELSSVQVDDFGDFDVLDDVSVSDSMGQCTTLDSLAGFSCTLDLLGGKTDTIKYVTTIDAGNAYDGMHVDNFAMATPDTYFDPDYASNFAFADSKVGEGPAEVADLGIQGTMPSTVSPGVPVTTTVKVSNKGPAAADTLAGFDSPLFDEDQAIILSADGCDTDTFTCDAGVLPKGGSKTFTIVWEIPKPVFGAASTALNGSTLELSSEWYCWVYSDDENQVDPVEDDDSCDIDFDIQKTSADLSITAAGPSHVLDGTQGTYVFTLANAGPDSANDVEAIVDLTQNESLVKSAGAGFTCGGITIVTCSYASPIKSGGTAQLTLTLAFNDTGDESGFSAEALMATDDSNPDNNETGVAVTIDPPNANVGVTNQGPAHVLNGQNVTNTIGVTNGGPLAATNVVVTDTLPPGETLVSVKGAKCIGNAPVTCAIPTLKAGGKAKITVVGTVNVDTVPSTLDNVAQVSSDLTDLDDSNDSSTAETDVVPPMADVAVTGKASPALVAKGGAITYTFTLKNLGPQATTGIDFQETLPAAVTLPTKAPAGCSFAGHVLNCAGGALKPGASKAISVIVKAPQTGNTVLTASATAAVAPTDPNTANNAASATSTTKP